MIRLNRCDATSFLARVGRQDRTRFDGLTFLVPAFPQVGDAEGPVVLNLDEVRLLGVVRLLPLVVAVCDDQAPA
jgi:hypothetical protein